MFKRMIHVNEGIEDRVIRFVIGGIAIFFSIMSLEGWMQIVGYVVGGALMITAVSGFCAAYALFGIKTNQ